MLAVVAKPTLVSELLHRQNVPVTTKDIHNLRQQLQFKGMLAYSPVFMKRSRSVEPDSDASSPTESPYQSFDLSPSAVTATTSNNR